MGGVSKKQLEDQVRSFADSMWSRIRYGEPESGKGQDWIVDFIMKDRERSAKLAEKCGNRKLAEKIRNGDSV